MTNISTDRITAIISEIASAIIGIISVLGTMYLAINQVPIPSTVMLLDGVAIGAFFGGKGANAIRAAVSPNSANLPP